MANAMTGSDVEVQFGANLSPLNDGFREAVDELKNNSKQMADSLRGIEDSLDDLKKSFKDFAAIVTATFGFAKSIEETRNFIMEADRLATTLGMTTLEVDGLGDALEIVGSSIDSYAAMSQRLTMRLNTQEDAFRKAGVATRNSNGDLLSNQEIIRNVMSTLEEYKAGTDRNIMAVQLLGRGYAEATKIMKAMKLDQDALSASSKELGLIVDKESVAAIHKYNAALVDGKEVVQGLQRVIAEAVMPAIIDLAGWMSENGPTAVNIAREAFAMLTTTLDVLGSVFSTVFGAVQSIMTIVFDSIMSVFGSDSEPMTGMQFFSNVCKVVQLAVVEMGAIIEMAFEGIRGALEIGTAVLRRWQQLAEDVIMGPQSWGSITANWRKGTEEIEKVINESAQRILKVDEDRQRRMTDILVPTARTSTPIGEGEKKGTRGAMDVSGKGGDDAKKARDDAFAMLKAQTDLELAEAKNNAERRLEITRAFVAEVGKLYGEGSKQFLDAKRMEVAAEQAFNASVIKEKTALIEAEQNAAVNALKIKQEELKFKQEIGLISASEEVAARADIDAQIYAVKSDALTQEIGLLDEGTEAYRKALEQRAALDQKYDLDKAKHRTEQGKADREEMEQWLGGITRTVAMGTQGVIMGTTTWRQVGRNFLGGVLGDVSTHVTRKVTNWIMGEVLMTQATAEQGAMRVGLEKTFSAEGIMNQAGKVLASIGNFAAEAFAGVWSALSGIPYVGPFLAAAAAPAALATVIGVGSMVTSSFDVGAWQVPQDTVAMVHKDEAVLRPAEAEEYRKGTGSRGGNMNVTIQALDARSLKRMLQNPKNRDALAGTLAGTARDFNRGKNS